MTIIVTKGNDVVYQQELASSDRINAVVGHLMGEPAGTDFTTVVKNNGQELTFRTASVNVDSLLRTANDIANRRPGKAKAAATPTA